MGTCESRLSLEVRARRHGFYRDGSECSDGGANRDRTDDLYNAIVALSQLSYSPTCWRTHRIMRAQPMRQARRPATCAQAVVAMASAGRRLRHEWPCSPRYSSHLLKNTFIRMRWSMIVASGGCSP